MSKRQEDLESIPGKTKSIVMILACFIAPPVFILFCINRILILAFGHGMS